MPVAVIAILQAVMALLPEVPELVRGVQTAIDLVTSGAAPTAAQQATIDAALEAANNAVQKG